MAVFEYRGLNEAGKNVTGFKEAESAKVLRGVLRKEGVFLTDVVGQAEGGAKGKPGRRRRAPSTRTSTSSSRAAASPPRTSRSPPGSWRRCSRQAWRWWRRSPRSSTRSRRSA